LRISQWHHRRIARRQTLRAAGNPSIYAEVVGVSGENAFLNRGVYFLILGFQQFLKIRKFFSCFGFSGGHQNSIELKVPHHAVQTSFAQATIVAGKSFLQLAGGRVVNGG